MAYKIFVCGIILHFSATVWGQPDELNFQDDLPLELDLSSALLRLPREVKPMVNKDTKAHIQELSVKTTIISRYAFTAVSCTMFNRHSAASEGVFHMHIPSDAYVSNFSIIIQDQVYHSEISPREKKVRKDKKAESHAQKGVQSEARKSEMEVFRVATSVPGKSAAVFLLTYEQVLQRRLGRYEHVTSLRPLQLVSRLSLDITIKDSASISQLQVLPMRNGKAAKSSGPVRDQTAGKTTLPVSTVIKKDNNVCKITFTPSIVQQAKIATNGILGDFVIWYDVDRELGIGDVQVLNGHFVHYFAPKNLPVVPKNIVFVIDTSASMIGTKLRQTKEAIFSILNDLQPNDNFNFVTFSNRIKVWKPGQLVHVTPDNVRDAKKFIYTITPSGGTDINRAIQTSCSLLSNYLSNEGSHSNAMSSIIFLTDSRPTVGELQSSSILEGVRAAVQEKFCIYTVGLGDDVDYRFLERLALENCGSMQRIPEKADGAGMLKRFYAEISSPLLTDVRVAYSEDGAELVTQHLFTSYTNGSEIVIAGKLTNQNVDSLHVQVTASNGDKSIALDAEVVLRERERAMEHLLAPAADDPHLHGFVERLWALMSIKDMLRSRLRSRTSWEKEELTQQAASLSMAYSFLTPLTRMVMEVPHARVDGSMVDNADVIPAAEESAGEKPQSLHRTTKVPGNLFQKTSKKSITISKTSADGDPHFVVEFPQSKLTVCFNINGEPGDILRLVSDHDHSGVTVNGKLIGAPAPSGSHKQQRTYFSTITVVVDRPRRGYIEITPRKVILDSKDRLVLPCHTTVAVESDGLAVAIIGRSNVTVTVQSTISFIILIHQYKNPAPYQRDHLGFYIANSKGLSRDSHGLLGQFLYQEVGLTLCNDTLSGQPTNGTSDALSTGPSPSLKIKDRTVAVVKKTRKIYSGRQAVDCWFVRNNAAKLIDGQYEDYLVPHIFETADSPHGKNTA